MPLQTFTIELRVNLTEEQHAVVGHIARQYARDFLASAMLVAGPRANPTVMCKTVDNFYEEKEIMLIAPGDSIHDGSE